jgi:hypothetical protein
LVELMSRAEADTELADWALGRFEQAGLKLPPLSIAFHDEKEACSGHYGFYRPSTPARIDICGFNRNRFLVTPKRTMLHELAHAWLDENLDDETRHRFLELRSLDAWNETSGPWESRGFEHAAEIITWGLIDEELSLAKIGDGTPRDLAAAYELLTSRRPEDR